jgi:outer membrane protein assembly factor BamB
MRTHRRFITMVAVLGLVAPTAARSADSYGRLVALDLATGRVRFDVAAPTAAATIHAIAPGVVVAIGSDDCSTNAGESAFAFSLVRGAIRWQRRLPGACDDYDALGHTSDGIVALDTRRGVEGWSVASGTTRWVARGLSEGVAAGSVVVSRGANGSLGLIDGRTGGIDSLQQLPRFSYGWLVTDHDAVFASPEHARLYSIDPSSGRTRWTRETPVPGESFRTLGGDGVVVVGRQVYDARSGRGLWRTRAAVAALGAGVAVVVRPSTVEALDIRTGRPRWTVPLAGSDRRIVAGDGVIALITRDTLTVLDAGSGATRWSQRLEGTRVRSYAPAAIANGVVLVTASSDDWVPYDA